MLSYELDQKLRDKADNWKVFELEKEINSLRNEINNLRKELTCAFNEISYVKDTLSNHIEYHN